MIIYCGNGVIFSVCWITIAIHKGGVESHPWKNRIFFHFSSCTNVNNRFFSKSWNALRYFRLTVNIYSMKKSQNDLLCRGILPVIVMQLFSPVSMNIIPGRLVNLPGVSVTRIVRSENHDFWKNPVSAYVRLALIVPDGSGNL